LKIFEELRQQRVPLGMSDYMLALKTVSELTNSEDLENIKGLCRLFWAKSYADQLLFDETFDIEVDKQLQAVQKKEQQTPFHLEQISFPSRPNTVGSNRPSPERDNNRGNLWLFPRLTLN